MLKWKKLYTVALSLVLIIVPVRATYAYSENTVLVKGMRTEDVLTLQKDLMNFGYFKYSPTGYFGNITFSAVLNFQKYYSLKADGIADNQTLGKIESIKSNSIAEISRGRIEREDKVLLLSWFEKVNGIFKIRDKAVITDLETGMAFQVIRTYGRNHADVETATSGDTAILKQIAGGEWNWTRRAIIVDVNGYRLAASMTAKPHAGRDDKPANIVVDNRSGGYGQGQNLDTVKDNNMDGHFDIHFLNSKTHGTNRINEEHQQMIQKAFELGK